MKYNVYSSVMILASSAIIYNNVYAYSLPEEKYGTSSTFIVGRLIFNQR